LPSFALSFAFATVVGLVARRAVVATAEG